MGSEGRTVVEVFGFFVGVLAVICLGAAAMSFVNVFAGFADGSSGTYVIVGLVSLVLAIGLGFAAGYLLSWSDPERRGHGGQGPPTA